MRYKYRLYKMNVPSQPSLRCSFFLLKDICSLKYKSYLIIPVKCGFKYPARGTRTRTQDHVLEPFIMLNTKSFRIMRTQNSLMLPIPAALKAVLEPLRLSGGNASQSILPFIPRPIRFLLFLILLLNCRSFPFLWHSESVHSFLYYSSMLKLSKCVRKSAYSDPYFTPAFVGGL